MKRKTTLAAVFLTLVMLFGLMPMPQPVAAATTCDWAQFVADVTIPDGTNFNAGTTFDKTWRLQNIGSCTWSTDYSLVFVDGQQMGAPASVKLPNSVAPGGRVNLTVRMTAPNSAATYRGNWQLRNASGVLFGIGATANKSFWVEIRVSGGGGTGTGYDFVDKAKDATWTSSAGALTFPGTDGDSRGFGLRQDSPKLENGTTDSAPGLLMVPQNVYNGFIQAKYPSFRVQSGDHFQSIFNCEYNATSCYVTFRLNYQIGDGVVQTFRSFNERYEGLYYRVDYDLSSLAGRDVKFILYIGAAGYATGDRALWGAPRITRGGGTPPTITPTVTGTPPTPTATNTPKPGTSTCRATFVSDVNYQDGTVVAPNTAFTKTWKIKNTGTCTWTTNFSLVFVSGDKMGGPDSQKLTSTVGPNTSFDISVNLTSPAANSSYKGFWQLKDDKGQLFGIGATGDKPWWVNIVVKNGITPIPTTVTPGSFGTVFDFVDKAKDATWTSSAGALTFPGTDGDTRGFGLRRDNPKLENGTIDSAPGLLMVPQNVYNGFIQAKYPSFRVQSGDHFQSIFNCEYNATSCYVTFRLNYQIGDGVVQTFRSFNERYEGLYYRVDYDLSSLAGQDVKFILYIGAAGYATGDRALWGAPRITRGGAVTVASPTNTGTATVTPTGVIPATVTPTVTPTVAPPAVTPTPTPTGTATPTQTTSNDGLAYANPFFGYQFKYLDTQIFSTDLPPNTIRYPLPFKPGTNLQDKYVEVVTTENRDPCVSSHQGNGASQTLVVNNLSFLRENGEDHGAGQIYTWISYSTKRANVCVTLTLVLHSNPPGVYPTPLPLYDRTAESAIIADIIPTFSWLTRYSVYGVKSNDVLNVRTSAGVGNPLATTLPYNEKDVFRTGSTATASSAEWWQIFKSDDTTGWVNASYLTEFRTSTTACADTRIGTLLANFDSAIKNANGTALSNLVSPKHGLSVRYSPNTITPVTLSKSAVVGIFASTTSYNWGMSPGSGANVVGTFKDKIQPKLLDVLNATYQTTCNDTSHTGLVTNPWPSEYTNLNFYALYKPGTSGTELDWRTWIAGIEYVNGVPYITALVHYQWAP